ncbi:MAG: DUF4249 family protein [Taibaiella sp.]|nr:DUF4249 family protein [Taibaiella sp.]
MKNYIVIAVLCTSIIACRKPAPLDIAVPQAAKTIVVSSASPNNRTLVIAAGYTFHSALHADSVTDNQDALISEYMIDSGSATLSYDGNTELPLHRITKGVFARNDLQLQPGNSYTLTVVDNKNNIITKGSAIYMSPPAVNYVTPVKTVSGTDTVVQLRFELDNVQPGECYYISYKTGSAIKPTGNSKKEILLNFEPKKVLLYSSKDAVNNKLSKTITLLAAGNDTIDVEIAKIDGGYYKYLDAYIKTGYLVNQLTGEPVNLPSNMSNGYGYFTMHSSKRIRIDMNTITAKQQ